MDPYTRARTVRIGKWRWPPPKDETTTEQPVEGFFEFKMRKMSEKKQGGGKPGGEEKVIRKIPFSTSIFQTTFQRHFTTPLGNDRF